MSFKRGIQRQLLWLLGIALLYWLPIFCSAAGWGRWDWLPRRVTFQHAVAALFPKRQTAWSHPVYEVRTDKTVGEWIELDRWLMSEAEVAGYRHRVDRLISIAGKSSRTGDSIFAGLARHAAARVARARPDAARGGACGAGTARVGRGHRFQGADAGVSHQHC